MAAKQGLTAHVYQASEDARRAVLSRAPPSVRSHSWLSNLNTTCTIKSAPPRTPEVMSMLSTKCGWLIKRNEQNVWQRRWCCVVPHTFLYYFDAEPIEAAGWDAPTAAQASNQHASASSALGQQQPVGIIDLECYTNVDRPGGMGDPVLELTGDPITNPDLRSFFFQGESPADSEGWTKALLSDRHSALRDEREAYRQVCDSFPLQLMHCSDLLDAAEARRQEAEARGYNVRCAAEETRLRVVAAVREAMEVRIWTGSNTGGGASSTSSSSSNKVNNHKSSNGSHKNSDNNNNNNTIKTVPSTATDEKYGSDLEQARRSGLAALDRLTTGTEAVAMNAGVKESVEILAHYAGLLRQERDAMAQDLLELERRVRRAGHGMVSRAEFEEAGHRAREAAARAATDRDRLEGSVAHLERSLHEETQRRVNAEKDLEAKNMEFTMLSAASKQKIQELSKHKKILKKEVIELRNKLEDVTSDATVFKHKTEGLETHVKAERERNIVLERHLEQVTGQIKMHERLVDMMSQGGGSSIYGGDSRADYHSVGGNSSYMGGNVGNGGTATDSSHAQRMGYPPMKPNNNQTRSGTPSVGPTAISNGNNNNEIPRYPMSSPRSIPPIITSSTPTSSHQKDRVSSTVVTNNEGDTSTATNATGNHNNDPKTNGGDDHGGGSSRNDHNHNHAILPVDSMEQQRAGKLTDQYYDDDADEEESRGNVSELTEDRTFRSEPHTVHINTSEHLNVKHTHTNHLPHNHQQQSHHHSISNNNSNSHNSSNNNNTHGNANSTHNNNTNSNHNHNNDVVASPSPNGKHQSLSLSRPPVAIVNEPSRSASASRPRPPLSSVEKSSGRHHHHSLHHPYHRTTTPVRDRPTHKVSIQNLPPNDSDAASVGTFQSGITSANSSGKFSVAQRARMEAESNAPARVIRVAPSEEELERLQLPPPPSAMAPAPAIPHSPSNGSVWERIGKTLVETIDGTPLAVRTDPDAASVRSETPSNSAPAPTPAPPLTLAQRQQQQREKQLAFLKQQGLLKADRHGDVPDHLSQGSTR